VLLNQNNLFSYNETRSKRRERSCPITAI
jgi:hypothetical protein